jgi:hypothetical protein
LNAETLKKCRFGPDKRIVGNTKSPLAESTTGTQRAQLPRRNIKERKKTVTRTMGIAISLAVASLFSFVGESLGGFVQAPAGAYTAKETRIAYLKKHAIPVRSIDAEDGNSADLEPLREVIGNRRIVMLGESTHGDGATFAAKIRLIKFLHERMGFDVLAFESGFYIRYAIHRKRLA